MAKMYKVTCCYAIVTMKCEDVLDRVHRKYEMDMASSDSYYL